MRLLPALFSIVSGGFIALGVACGGSADQDVLSASSSGATSSSSGSSSGETTSSSGTTTSGSSSGTTTSGSSGTTTSSSGSSSGQVNPTCTPEEELNNDPNGANQLAGSVCGSLLTNADVDYLTFTLKQGTKTMDFTFSGNVKIQISVGDEEVELSPQSNPPIPFVVGKPYLVRISSNGGAAAKVDWRVNLATS